MNRNTVIILTSVVAMLIGVAIGKFWDPADSVGGGIGDKQERQVLYWQAPMDPAFRRDEPGKSPMGMDLVPVYADEAGAETGVVLIDSSVVSNLGVRSAEAVQGPLSKVIETVGYVGYDEDTLHHIHTRVDGWIEKLSVTATGDPVRNGQTLFELYSPTLVNAQQEYLSALSRSPSLVTASRDRLLALGFTERELARLDKEREVRQRVQIRATSHGFVAHLGVREGIFITPATEVMSIAQLDRVWVQAEVFERQSNWVRPGQRAEIELDYLPGERWQGTVDYIYPELDERTRTLRVRLRFANEGEVLRPNMFARVTLYGNETEPLLHIPRAALIRGGKSDRVVLALGDGRFRAQPVTTGIESGDRVAILSGLSAGDFVVTSGQFLIDSESNIDSALQRLDSSTSGDESPHDGTMRDAIDHSAHRPEDAQ
ncbi:MAG: efflux RND transporter periplasmic adaptor subunit [Gammaproteobacteria bacterium]|nr:efflux RND transporter periplasmic adaptor subunit [Gammaproteobacteria bacterium]MDH4313213.1 efflux RND transporter periplasmic adaptor subunit [Gammaproteobacteria bacterium]